jgi:hypothetical protein
MLATIQFRNFNFLPAKDVKIKIYKTMILLVCYRYDT